MQNNLEIVIPVSGPFDLSEKPKFRLRTDIESLGVHRPAEKVLCRLVDGEGPIEPPPIRRSESPPPAQRHGT